MGVGRGIGIRNMGNFHGKSSQCVTCEGMFTVNQFLLFFFTLCTKLITVVKNYIGVPSN